MADGGFVGPGTRLDMQDLQKEAQHRWLRPAEICEILRNYQRFQISSKPANKPPSGSLFLFNRKALRYFRKDGHNWRKEAHEKLKVGNVDGLQCYYARGEENECFQRRTYWLLEKEFLHIVFVHYLGVKGNRSTIRETEPAFSNSQLSNSPTSSVSTNYNEAFSGNAGSPSAVSSLKSSYEEIESEYHQSMSKYPSLLCFPYLENSFSSKKMASPVNPNFVPTYPGNQHSDPLLVCDSVPQSGSGITDCNNQFGTLELASWEEILNQCTQGSGNLGSHPVINSTLPVHTGTPESYSENLSQLLYLDMGVNCGLESALAPYDLQRCNPSDLSSTEAEDDMDFSVTAKKPLLGSIKAEDGLQKVDSFSKWMTKELDGVEDLDLKSSSNRTWLNIETAIAAEDPSVPLEDYSMSPSIGHDQLFDIHDFSPSCACTNTETKVVITGKFLVSQLKISNYNWSCMFGEVEVPAKVLRNDALCCYAPSHNVGHVPFYVTCSNRFACSQVREFDFIEESQNVDSIIGVKERQLVLRLEKILSNRSLVNAHSVIYTVSKQPIVEKICLLMEDELCLGVEQTLIDKLFSWLLDKVNDEDGKGPNMLDEAGQGLLHLAAALGNDWMIPPILAAGVSVNFRDVNGWTALHWAACYGREMTVALLIALGAAPGALTDPSPEFPLGRTPADLASDNGYKGISGYLAESSLTVHLSSLTMSDKKLDSSLENSIVKAVQTVKEKVATPDYDGDGTDLSLKDSLMAVQNATQAAGRIHQVFRMQSFQRKQISNSTNDEFLLADERVLSLISSKLQRPGHLNEQAHSAAAVQIQKEFRGWKKRKEFLIIRERVVKIQAHVRGHQVRKHYKTVVWSVSILDKVILRWRRKGTGLRGFQPDALNKVPITQGNLWKDDYYDYLKEGRKQTEERLQKALVRVKSMVQYPEGRAQYRRLLTAVEGFQKNQLNMGNKMLDSLEMPVVEGEEDMIDVESLLADDGFMAVAFE